MISAFLYRFLRWESFFSCYSQHPLTTKGRSLEMFGLPYRAVRKWSSEFWLCHSFSHRSPSNSHIWHHLLEWINTWRNVCEPLKLRQYLYSKSWFQLASLPLLDVASELRLQTRSILKTVWLTRCEHSTVIYANYQQQFIPAPRVGVWMVGSCGIGSQGYSRLVRISTDQDASWGDCSSA